jgi:ferredoxin-NADP reductase
VIDWQNAIVREIVVQTPRIKSFSFELPQPFSYIAGQHVDVRLTAPDGYHAMRSYSIASAPASGARIELAVERLDDGEVSPFFHEIVTVGDAIELRGPLGGYFIWNDTDVRPLLLIGGGSGVVPLVSMLRQRHLVRASVPAALLYSARTWTDVLYPDELLALERDGNGFELAFTITREPARRTGDFSRRIDPAMVRDVIARMPQPPQLAYVCGSNMFVDAATNAAIEAGVPTAMIRTERYGV